MDFPIIDFTERDKQQHAVAGAIIAGLVEGGTIPLRLSTGERFLVTMGAVTAAAIGKELADKTDPERHTCECRDAFATILGGLAVAVPIAGAELAFSRDEVRVAYTFRW